MSLRDEALEIVSELSLLPFLGKYGRAELVGSVALDLVVKLDIDIHLLVDDRDLIAVVNRVYPQLLRHPKVFEVRITDYRDGSVKIGVDRYASRSGGWSLDLFITNRTELTAFQATRELAKSLDQESRVTIMALKRHYHALGLLRDGLSHRIYMGVTRHGVRSVEEFEKLVAQDDSVE